jgi:hypothetical protein
VLARLRAPVPPPARRLGSAFGGAPRVHPVTRSPAAPARLTTARRAASSGGRATRGRDTVEIALAEDDEQVLLVLLVELDTDALLLAVATGLLPDALSELPRSRRKERAPAQLFREEKRLALIDDAGRAVVDEDVSATTRGYATRPRGVRAGCRGVAACERAGV